MHRIEPGQSVTPISRLLRDPFKRLLFELGAGYYARKLATGPEADLRSDFVEFLNLPPASEGKPRLRILDVGCGPGHVARALARRGYDVTGVDRGWRLLRIARRLAAREGVEVRFESSASDKLSFADAFFDCAIATGVIYWVEHPDATLREMVRVTRPGGFIASLDPHASMSIPRVRIYNSEHHLNRRDARKMIAWATSAEFNRRFQETKLRDLLTHAGLANLTLEHRLDGMVWFSKGFIPNRA
ncbi:MAG: class I SAM-dependent methyltransferase [Candidatus Acidiferrales bacterium]